MRDESYEFLKTLLSTPGPSGNEGAPAKIWREEAGNFSEVHGDRMGNSFATLNGGGSPRIMLSGHIDEIGLMVTHIDDQGLAPLHRCRRLGFSGARRPAGAPPDQRAAR